MRYKLWSIGLAISCLAAFFFLIHGLLLAGELSSIKDIVRHIESKSAIDMDSAIRSMNTFEIRRLLLLIKNERVSLIEFEFSNSFSGANEIVRVGQLQESSRWVQSYSDEIEFSGAKLGRLSYTVDLLNLSQKIILRNSALYVLLLFVFSTLILLSNLTGIHAIRSINRALVRLVHYCQGGRKDGSDPELAELWEKVQLPFAEKSIKTLARTLRELIATENLYSATKAREELSRQVAHDIRSPVSFIKAFLKRNSDVPHSQALQVAADRIEDIANNLLGQTRTSTPTISESQPVRAVAKAEQELDLQSICSQVVFEKKVSHPDIQIEVQGERCWAKGRADHTYRVFSNLLENSLQALKMSQRKQIYIDFYEQGDQVGVDIRDSGTGISNEILQKIENGQAVTSKADGNGLGVSGSLKMMREMGGTLRAFSDGKSWTTIKLSFAKSMTVDQPETLRLKDLH